MFCSSSQRIYRLCQCFECSPTLFLVVSECQIFDTLWVIYLFFSSCNAGGLTERLVYTRQALYHWATLPVPLIDFRMEQEIVVMFQSFPVVFLELCRIPLVLPLGILPLPLPPYVYLSIVCGMPWCQVLWCSQLCSFPMGSDCSYSLVKIVIVILMRVNCVSCDCFGQNGHLFFRIIIFIYVCVSIHMEVRGAGSPGIEVISICELLCGCRDSNWCPYKSSICS